MKDWTKFDALVRSVMICHKFGHKEPHYTPKKNQSISPIIIMIKKRDLKLT